MKSFKTFLTEEPKSPSNLALTRKRQDAETDDVKNRHNRELEKARQDDFKKREAEKKNKESGRDYKNKSRLDKIHRDRETRFREKEASRRIKHQKKQAEKEAERNMAEDITSEEYDVVYEYLEDGTIEIVTAYKKATPGQ